MTTLSAIAERHLPYSCATLFDAFLKPDQAAADSPQGLLSMRHIWGNRDSVGSQTILRLAAGSFDLELKETIRRIDAPLLYEAQQEALRFLPYDRTERVPPFPPDNREPDRAFRDTYGSERASWVVKLTCAPNAGGCDVAFSMTMTSEKIGWLARRIAPKQIRKRLDAGLDDVARYLANRHIG